MSYPANARSRLNTQRTFATSKQEESAKNSHDWQAKDAENAAAEQITTKTTPTPKKLKTVAELDEELRQKMSGLSGEGGESGIEYENGKPVAMKRSVKNNMFRYV